MSLWFKTLKLFSILLAWIVWYIKILKILVMWAAEIYPLTQFYTNTNNKFKNSTGLSIQSRSTLFLSSFLQQPGRIFFLHLQLDAHALHSIPLRVTFHAPLPFLQQQFVVKLKGLEQNLTDHFQLLFFDLQGFLQVFQNSFSSCFSVNISIKFLKTCVPKPKSLVTSRTCHLCFPALSCCCPGGCR